MGNDFQEKLIDIIAAKVITQGHMSDLPMPEGFGTIRWTGWKSHWGEMYPHAQLVWRMDRRAGQNRAAYYVDLPSMKHGTVKEDGVFEIGFTDSSHYLSEYTTVDEIREWFKEAFSLLINDVLTDNPWLTTVPTVKG